MINLSIDDIRYAHERLIQRTGGMPSVRDLGLLESAVYSAMQSFGEEEVYPTPVERAARLAYSITMNHPFLDGNKRAGMLAMLMTLKLNHIALAYAQRELIDLGLSVADGRCGYPEILNWIEAHEPMPVGQSHPPKGPSTPLG
jgi:death-on-curing protein